MKSSKIGLIAAPNTAMDTNGDIRLDAIERQAELLIANGVKGAFVCGTAGEGTSLTVDERMQVAERWMEVAGADLDILVHVGHAALRDSQTLAAHANSLKVAAISALTPSLYKPSGIGEIVTLLSAIASSAPQTPFYYYHMPLFTGVNVSAADFLDAAAPKIPTLTGIKFTDLDLMNFGQAASRHGDRFRLLSGRDEVLLPALTLGAHGAIGSTYNIAAPIFGKVIERYLANDIPGARAAQFRGLEVIRALVSNGRHWLAAAKATMGLLGVDCGSPRLPVPSLTRDELSQLRADLEAIDFFSDCSKLSPVGCSVN